MIAVLLLFPAFIACDVNINITPASDSSSASVSVTGTSTWTITQADQRVFHITDAEVKRNTMILGSEPKTVTVRRDKDDPHGIQVTVKPIKTEILKDVKEESVIIAKKEFTNRILVPTLYKIEFQEDVNEVISTSWSTGPTLDSSKISITFANGKFSVDSAWGQQVYKSVSRRISAHSGAEMTLNPGQGVHAVLRATKATMQVKIDYEATLRGNICMKYVWVLLIPDNKCKIVQHYLDEQLLPTVLTTSEVITVDYYFGARVEVLGDNQENSYTQGF